MFDHFLVKKSYLEQVNYYLSLYYTIYLNLTNDDCVYVGPEFSPNDNKITFYSYNE